MRKMPDKAQYLAWAAKARGQADDATTATARAIHLELAAGYEAKAADADDAPPEEPPPAPPTAGAD
ncbi:MAG: hypothetical protein V4475_07810 [Pseudomonadota bacterium]